MKRDWPNGGRREWVVRRNCSLTPQQTLAAWGALLALSLAIGVFFALQGAWYILAFSGLEMTAVTVAFALYSRHATDQDRIVYDNGTLVVEKVRGGHSYVFQLDPFWLSIVPPRRRRDPIRLEARGISVTVGKWLPEPGRQALARELREGLAQ